MTEAATKPVYTEADFEVIAQEARALCEFALEYHNDGEATVRHIADLLHQYQPPICIPILVATIDGLAQMVAILIKDQT